MKQTPGPHPFIAGILALVLPSPERDKHTRRVAIDVPFWSLLIGVVEVLGGFLVLFADWHSSVRELTARMLSDVAAADPSFGDTFEERWILNWSGALTAMVYFARPKTWLLASVPLVGAVRMLSFSAPKIRKSTRQPRKSTRQP